MKVIRHIPFAVSYQATPIRNIFAIGVNFFIGQMLHRANPKIFRGKVWNYLKPKYEESIYFKVFDNFDNVEVDVCQGDKLFLNTLIIGCLL